MTTRARYVILCVGGLSLAIAVGLLVALGLRSLSAGQPPTGAAAPTDSTPTSAPPAPTPTTAAEAPAPRPEAGRNECVDDLGDGGVDLDSVKVAMRDDDLAVQFILAAPLPNGESLPDGESGLGLYVERNGDKAYQLGIAFVDGQVDDVFVRDFDKSDEYAVDSYEVNLRGSDITIVFPEDSIKRLGDKWSWYAFATASGAELDACPGSESDLQLLQFER